MSSTRLPTARGLRSSVVATILAITAALPSFVYSQAATPRGPHSTEELARAYASAHQRKEIAAIEQLFYWGGATAVMKQTVLKFVARDLGRAPSKVSIQPVDPHQLTEYTQQGVNYRMTLKPVANLQIDFPPHVEGGVQINAEHTTYAIGVRDGAYYLVTAEAVP